MKGKAPSRLAEQRLWAVPVPDVGRMNIRVQQMAERVDKDVSIAAKGL
jgi:hypothetical protein